MEHKNFIINTFVEELRNHTDDSTNFMETFKNAIKQEGVHFKDYPDSGLILLFSDFNKLNKTSLERECRSLILNRDTFEIVSYSCDDPLCNAEAKHFLLNNHSSEGEQTIFQCYEGSLLAVFNFNGKWFVTTRKCLDSKKSTWKGDKSHYSMFLEAVEDSGINDIDEFTNKLNPSHCYYFILLHHENINVVDYSKKFGENYKKLVLGFVRNQKSQEEVDIYNQEKLSEIMSENVWENFIIPEKYEDLSKLEEENNKGYIEIPAENEGMLIKVTENNKTFLLKFQTSDYLFGLAVGPDKNIYKGFLKLYQTNNLSDYLQNNKNFDLYKKIVNPHNTMESFDTVGTVDALFKVCTSETYEQFKLLWDIKTGKHKNKELYNYLTQEHKELLFAIRGIYFQKKAEYITNKKNNTSNDGKYVQRSVLKISDIYELFKSYDINKLEAFLKSRKLMINLVNKEKNNPTIQLLKSISNRCDKVLLKLIAIYTSHLFPELTNEDIPDIETDEQPVQQLQVEMEASQVV
ncbi:hypothetical protein CPAV1605_949 [seawater metagenome]|uniref:RNA ligase n=1 Tax=seawater metagenome TaxID=1561972 RepID=A0A5E8CKJ2_9ZZZZ